MSSVPRDNSNGRLNILLITVDSLRADHLGCYGYYRETSPRIDELAAEGAMAEQLLCSSIPTHPSYTTLYTGQHAITHNIVAHAGRNELSRRAPFLSELFMEAGYTTCAVDNLMRARLWFGRGYEFYIDSSIKRPLVVNVSAEDISRRAIEWLRHYADEAPFFMFLHYWDPHYPFVPPQPYRHLFYDGDNPTDPDNHSLDPWWRHPLGFAARETWLRTQDGHVTDPDYVVALYDQEIRYLDDGVNELLEALDTMGLSENTLVLFVADHGESMTEHGVFFEHHGLYDPVLHIPFIARLPGRIPAGLRLPHVFQTQDFAPTVLEAAGVSIPREMDGQSIWRLLTGEEKEGGYEQVISLECSWQAKWSLRTDCYKFILARELDLYGTPMRELYDLIADPGEERNIADEQPEVSAEMEAELERWIADRLQALGRSEDPLVKHGISLLEGHPKALESLWDGED
jgi:arylsulfatase A-like enzyme